MSLVRGNSYSRAGFGELDRDKFEINKSVFILDATAGQGYDAYDERLNPAVTRTHQESFGVSARHVVMLFAALVLLLLSVCVVKHVNIRRLAYDVSVLEEHVKALSETNYDLDKQVMAAREMTHISLNATKLGMVLIEEQEVYHVTAPETRPFAAKGSTIE